MFHNIQAYLRRAAFLRQAITTSELQYRHGPSTNDRLDSFDLIWPHIIPVASWLLSESPKDRAMAEMLLSFQNAGAYLFDFRQSLEERIRWQKGVLAAARRLSRRLDETAALCNLGIAYIDARKSKLAVRFLSSTLSKLSSKAERLCQSFQK